MSEYEFDVGLILEDITGGPLDYRRHTNTGQQLRCPFHDDRKPSAWISRDKRGFDCKSCGRRGDAISILRQEEGLDFKGAVARAQEITGTPGESGAGTGSSNRGSNAVPSFTWDL